MATNKQYYTVAPAYYGGGNGGAIVTSNNVIWNTNHSHNWNVQYSYSSGAEFKIAEPARPKSKFGDDFHWLKDRVDEYINDFDRTVAA